MLYEGGLEYVVVFAAVFEVNPWIFPHGNTATEVLVEYRLAYDMQFDRTSAMCSR